VRLKQEAKMTTTERRIQDPFLRFNELQYQTIFRETEILTSQVLLGGAKAFEELSQFHLQVKTSEAMLQSGQADVFDLGPWELEKEKYLQAYWSLKQTAEKIGVYARSLEKLTALLTPENRSYTEQQRISEEFPDWFQQQQRLDQICQGYIDKLKTSSVQDWHHKIFTLIDNGLSNSLARFCQIVDRKGKPLSYWQLWSSQIPPIPQPQKTTEQETSLSIQLPSVQKILAEYLVAYPQFYNEWQQKLSETESLYPTIKAEGSALQNQLPSQLEPETLKQKRETYAEKYWSLKETAEKVNVLSISLERFIAWLTSQGDTPSDSKATGQDEMEKLQQHLSDFKRLHQKMKDALNGEFGWSVQRFCQIVDNQGVPLGLLQRGWNKLVPPVVPKPNLQARQQQSEKISFEQNGSLAFSTINAQSKQSPSVTLIDTTLLENKKKEKTPPDIEHQLSNLLNDLNSTLYFSANNEDPQNWNTLNSSNTLSESKQGKDTVDSGQLVLQTNDRLLPKTDLQGEEKTQNQQHVENGNGILIQNNQENHFSFLEVLELHPWALPYHEAQKLFNVFQDNPNLLLTHL
jgi:hypothetical protein